MGTRQVPLCWPEPVCLVSGYSSMSLVSAWSGHAEGTDTLQLLVILCLQNPLRLSEAVVHLGLCQNISVRIDPRRNPLWSALAPIFAPAVVPADSDRACGGSPPDVVVQELCREPRCG